MLRFALIASLFASTALAVPGYYRVTGVAADDTLNVRAAPDGDSEDIGDLSHSATGIEVIETDDSGDWGRIIWQEASGWIAMRFLEAYQPATIGETTLPVGLLCSGSEPFWSVRFADTTTNYADVEGNSAVLVLDRALVATGRPAFPASLLHTADDISATSVLRAQNCSDGMSDRDYGYSIAFLLEVAGQAVLFEGCCQLPLEDGSN